MFCAGSRGSSVYISRAISGVRPMRPILPFGEIAVLSPALSTAMTARMSSAGMLYIAAARSIWSGGASLRCDHQPAGSVSVRAARWPSAMSVFCWPECADDEERVELPISTTAMITASPTQLLQAQSRRPNWCCCGMCGDRGAAFDDGSVLRLPSSLRFAFDVWVPSERGGGGGRERGGGG